MRELNTNEIKGVNGGFWHRLVIGAIVFIANLDYSNSNINSDNPSAATNRL